MTWEWAERNLGEKTSTRSVGHCRTTRNFAIGERGKMCICGTVIRLRGREGADRAMIRSGAMRVIIRHCPKGRVPVFTSQVSGPVGVI